jgi:predicted enzyme related to lactoylglutathione lyase
MRRHAILLVALVVLVLCGSSATVAMARTATPTATPTTLPIETVPATTSGTPSADAPTGKILMVKLSVSNLDAAEKFYGAVFGAKLAVKVGGNAHIVTFPDGGPGLVLIKSPVDKKKQGAFIVQVPDRNAAVALAVTNGAKEQAKFAGTPASQAAVSTDLLDPWGNQVEILQLG